MFYMPFGFFGVLAIAGRVRVFLALALAIITGALLSISMELTQYYVRAGVTAADDVYANATGTALGAVVGSIAYGNFRWPLLREITSDRVPSLLLAVWLGYRLFPSVPTIDLHKYWGAPKPVILYPSLTGYDLFRYTATWLTLGALIEAIAAPKRAWFLFPLFIGSMLIAKVVIVDKTLDAAEVVGAGLALAVWLTLAVSVGARFRVTFIALLFSVSVIAERLAPFEFTAQARQFGWVPFLSFMYGSLEVGIMSAALYNQLGGDLPPQPIGGDYRCFDASADRRDHCTDANRAKGGAGFGYAVTSSAGRFAACRRRLWASERRCVKLAGSGFAPSGVRGHGMAFAAAERLARE